MRTTDIKNNGVVAKRSANKSMGVLADLLIIATFLALLTAFDSPVFALWPYAYVWVEPNQGLYLYRSVRGNQTTNYFDVPESPPNTYTDCVSSWMDLLQDGTFTDMQIGIVKGWVQDPNGTMVWFDEPHYYVETTIGFQFNDTYFNPPATIGETHQYWVYLNTFAGTNFMVACMDGTVLKVQTLGIGGLPCQASGTTESHDLDDEMNSYFCVMTAGTNWNNPVPFTNVARKNYYPPYYYFPSYCIDRWRALTQGS